MPGDSPGKECGREPEYAGGHSHGSCVAGDLQEHRKALFSQKFQASVFEAEVINAGGLAPRGN